MKSEPYTIKIFVPDGDPEGIRIIEQMNRAGKGIIFPRLEWANIKDRPEFKLPGVYFLIGQAEEDDLPTVYIGQGDYIYDRLEFHTKEKDFWDRAIIFISTNSGLNRGHITWLEYALIQQARKVGRCRLDNAQIPNEPALSEAEKADTSGFLKQILQILPLVGLRALESPRAVATPKATSQYAATLQTDKTKELDTVVVPAQEEGFQKVFLGENCWHAIRISGGMLPKIKYIAAYQSHPISAITHYAPVDRIEPYGEDGKYKLIFSEKAKPITPIPFADSTPGMMQSPRYANFERLQTAKKITDVFS